MEFRPKEKHLLFKGKEGEKCRKTHMEWDTSIDERGKEADEEEGESPKARHVFLAFEESWMGCDFF